MKVMVKEEGEREEEKEGEMEVAEVKQGEEGKEKVKARVEEEVMVKVEVRDLEELEEKIKECKECSLYKTRKNVVVGAGGYKKRIMLVGEAPGRNEDEQGLPFVGRAGEFLNELLSIAGLTREDVYITNVVKCRPPSNRDPTPQEVEVCSKWLEMQISIMKPRIIITLGRISLSYFQQKFNLPRKTISQVHGEIMSVNTLTWQGKIIAMYHPAAALYNPVTKEKMMRDWEDIKEQVVKLYNLK